MMGFSVFVLVALFVFYSEVGIAKSWKFQNKDLDCLVTKWSVWTEPDSSGKISRERIILRYPTGNGKACPSKLKQTRYTDIDCKVSQWSQWHGHFGFGQQSRQRRVKRRPAGAGKQCPVLEEVRYTGNPPNVTVTAKNVVMYFIRPDVDKIPSARRGTATGKVRDLLLIMDSSGSIGSGRFSTAKSDIRRLFGLLCPLNKPFDKLNGHLYQYNQAAMLTYSTNVYQNFDFDEYDTTKDVLNAISGANYYGQDTYTHDAFNRAKTLFETSPGVRDKKFVKHEVLILTDGKSEDGMKAIAAAASLQEEADVYGLMIGSFSPQGIEELTKYVSSPVNEHLFYIKDFRDLTSLVNHIEKLKTQSGKRWCAPFVIN